MKTYNAKGNIHRQRLEYETFQKPNLTSQRQKKEKLPSNFLGRILSELRFINAPIGTLLRD